MWFSPNQRAQLTSQAVESGCLTRGFLTRPPNSTDHDAELGDCRVRPPAQFPVVMSFAVNGFGRGVASGKSLVVDPHGPMWIAPVPACQEEHVPDRKSTFDGAPSSAKTGMKGSGQVLKSFRDRSIPIFSIYDRSKRDGDAYLNTLGPLEVRNQGTRAVCSVDVARTAACPMRLRSRHMKQQYLRSTRALPPTLQILRRGLPNYRRRPVAPPGGSGCSDTKTHDPQSS